MEQKIRFSKILVKKRTTNFGTAICENQISSTTNYVDLLSVSIILFG